MKLFNQAELLSGTWPTDGTCVELRWPALTHQRPHGPPDTPTAPSTRSQTHTALKQHTHSRSASVDSSPAAEPRCAPRTAAAHRCDAGRRHPAGSGNTSMVEKNFLPTLAGPDVHPTLLSVCFCDRITEEMSSFRVGRFVIRINQPRMWSMRPRPLLGPPPLFNCTLIRGTRWGLNPGLRFNFSRIIHGKKLVIYGVCELFSLMLLRKQINTVTHRCGSNTDLRELIHIKEWSDKHCWIMTCMLYEHLL